MKRKFFLGAICFFALYSNLCSQPNDIALFAEFVNKDGYFRKGWIFSKDKLEIRVIITNNSKNDMFIPRPETGRLIANPIPIIKTSRGDSLECRMLDAKDIPVSHKPQQYCFELLGPGQSIRLIIDLLKDCNYTFERGKRYNLLFIFSSSYKGEIIALQNKYRIWNGQAQSNYLEIEF